MGENCDGAVRSLVKWLIHDVQRLIKGEGHNIRAKHKSSNLKYQSD